MNQDAIDVPGASEALRHDNINQNHNKYDKADKGRTTQRDTGGYRVLDQLTVVVLPC